jgi:hypothetical protein
MATAWASWGMALTPFLCCPYAPDHDGYIVQGRRRDVDAAGPNTVHITFASPYAAAIGSAFSRSPVPEGPRVARHTWSAVLAALHCTAFTRTTYRSDVTVTPGKPIHKGRKTGRMRRNLSLMLQTLLRRQRVIRDATAEKPQVATVGCAAGCRQAACLRILKQRL